MPGNAAKIEGLTGIVYIAMEDNLIKGNISVDDQKRTGLCRGLYNLPGIRGSIVISAYYQQRAASMLHFFQLFHQNGLRLRAMYHLACIINKV